MRTLSLLLATVTICTAAVTPPDQLKVPPGFKVELLREAGPGEGSWICMTQDDAGRLYIASQNGSFAKDGAWGGIWRVTLADETTKGTKDTKIADGAQPGEIRNPQSAIRNFEKVPLPVGDAMGMLWAFDSLYVSGMGPQGRGIYRCTSSKRDGNLDTATLFKAIPGGAGEHGAHAIVLGPDKKLYIVNGNSTGILDGLSPDSPYRHWGEDDLLPRLKDPVATFFDKIKAPYGCVYRTDADGTKWELFAGGFRNPYDIAFNPDGELFTYDADMEWDRGLPWYRPTRILHVVPGGEYGFREGSAKWPAYFPDSLPAVADIGVGCPTGIAFYPSSRDVGTDAKLWPEKYRRALFLHDWTYGRILAVTLHEKGASYTARNDLASYTYPRDAEANGDVEVFLSGKGMPVTDLEFLRDGSMVFTVGGRGTAAALYRVSYAGKSDATSAPDGAQDQNTSPLSLAEVEAAISHAQESLDPHHLDNRAIINELVKVGVDSETIAAAATKIRRTRKSQNDDDSPRTDDPKGTQRLWNIATISNAILQLNEQFRRFQDHVILSRQTTGEGDISDMEHAVELTKSLQPAEALVVHLGLHIAKRGGAQNQDALLRGLQHAPWTKLDDFDKIWKLRVLELSFARQGRPSEERVKALMEELLAIYTPPAGIAGRPRDPAAGAPVDDPAWRLNRELCALLVWLSNPELGELNVDLIEKAKAPAPAPAGKQGIHLEARKPGMLTDAKETDGSSLSWLHGFQIQNNAGEGKTGDFRPDSGPAGRPGEALAQNVSFSAENGTFSVPKGISATARDHSATARDRSATPGNHSATARDRSATPENHSATPPNDSATRLNGSATRPELLLAQANAPLDPEKEGKAPNPPNAAPASLGPAPNPGADVFPGRKGAAFHAEMGRQVIEKTLALMEGAPSQEEQIWYALCLRWAHGWTPELRVRYFRWFHEKAARYTGGNSFAKFVEAIRADAASRVPEAERQPGSPLAEWMHPVATPRPAVLKPRDFVKAWTLPDIEAALDKLKDRKPDLARGRDLYTQAQCAQCHLFRDAGGNVGPDLTAVTQRFGRHDILESITDPSKVIGDQYAMITLTILDGKGGTSELSGLVKEESSATITLLTDPLAGKTANLYKNVIVKREKSAVSIMPPGLLYTLTAEEVADLIGFLGAK